MPEMPPIEIRSYSKGYGQPETGLSNQSAMQFATARAEQLQQREMRDMNMRHAGSAIEKYFGSNAPLISAMLGNIDVETGGTFDFQQKQKGGNGYGLFQFDFHKPFYKKFLNENNLTDGVDSQVRYAYENIYGNLQDVLGSGNAEKLRKSFETSKDPMKLSDDIMNIFLRPGVPHAERRRESSRMHSLAITPAK
tara:strand:- start:790 stop:1371 length:582 start_codon:yes stop_codon:yes gene_type:complete